MLGLREIACDVYLVYKPGIARETERPPRPTLWMHQLQGADRNLLLCENPALSGNVKNSVEIGERGCFLSRG
jgi:hypothetical protein